MSCALTAVLLPESRARTAAIYRKPCFLDPPLHAHRSVHARAVPACKVRSYGVSGRRSRNDALSTGGQCLAPRVGGDHWSSPDRDGTRLGGQCAIAWTRDRPGGTVPSYGAESGMRGHLD